VIVPCNYGGWKPASRAPPQHDVDVACS
jgi:hypothetical protein